MPVRFASLTRAAAAAFVLIVSAAVLAPSPTDARVVLNADLEVGGVCGDPVALVAGINEAVGEAPARVVTATDALFVLRAALGLDACEACVCDLDGSGAVTAADALGTLVLATGGSLTPNCPPCDMTSTTSTTLCPQALPETNLNFGVTEDSEGVAGTAVDTEATAGEEAGDLFTSGGTGAHSPDTAGSNTQAVDESELGLSPSDELDAVSFGPFVPAPFQVFFSLADSDRIQGVDGTDVRVQDNTEVVPGDIFFSNATPDDIRGSNTLSLDEIQLGLEPYVIGGPQIDDLDALDFSDPEDPYFYSLARAGGTGGASIYRAEGGSASLIMSADDLGLLDTDEVDAFVLQDVDEDGFFGSGDYVIFSVSIDSAGQPGTAVRNEAIFGEVGGDLFFSFGDGTHGLAVDEDSLGLLPTDDIDALAFRRPEASADCGCGDGVLVAPEECEVGIPCANANATCNLVDCTCSVPFCEDGILTPPEQCEPGVIPCPPGQFCLPNCKCVVPKTCPNGILDPGEQCEVGIACPNPGDVCNPNTCQCSSEPYCGNGMLDAGEQCEPGVVNCPEGETCNALSCQCLPDDAFLCPNGTLDAGEECEVGIECPEEDDYCIVSRCECVSTTCEPDGVVNGAEACDPLAIPNGCEFEGVSCNEQCECNLYTARCNDGVYTPDIEECDRVTIGAEQIEVGCDDGEQCNQENCMCEPCFDESITSVAAILYQGFFIPTCQLILANPDACPDMHWHGQGYGFDDSGDIAFFVDPNPFECGYGALSVTPEQQIDLDPEVGCGLVTSGVSCIPTP